MVKTRVRLMMCLAAVAAWPIGQSTSKAAVTLRPVKDGTLVDGGIYGAFDGLPDAADWVFNQSSYEGSITLVTSTPESSIEHRVVWEYNLASVTLTPPVAAKLYFKLRGAPVFPRPPATVRVYAYPSDLQETMADFHQGPAVLQGSVDVAAFQPPTLFSLDVSAVVSAALSSGADRAAFRFQIDGETTHLENQAFIDALDADPATKPYLVVDEYVLPGDINGDGFVDLGDFAQFPDCMAGPGADVGLTCQPYDFDGDNDVDLGDFALFQTYFTGSGE